MTTFEETCDQYLKNDNYTHLLKFLNESSHKQTDIYFMYLGIAYYKLSQFENAESAFDCISTPSIEIQSYQIITKIKQNKMDEAKSLFYLLSEQINPQILYAIDNEDINTGKALCMFMQSIPIKRGDELSRKTALPKSNSDISDVNNITILQKLTERDYFSALKIIDMLDQ